MQKPAFCFILACFYFFLFNFHLLANVINDSRELLIEGNDEEAIAMVDAHLEANPDDAEVWYFKSFILYHKYGIQHEEQMVLNENLSIYDQSISIQQQPPKTFRKQHAIELNEVWKRYLELNPEHEEIWYSVAFVYTAAGLSDSLKVWLTAIKEKWDNESPNFLIRLMGYPEGLLNRGYFEESIDVYSHLADLFPQFPAVYAEIAMKFYARNLLDSAVYYIAKATRPGTMDGSSYRTAFLFYGVSGDTSSALNALQIADVFENTREHLLYRAFLKIELEEDCKKDILNFISETEPEEDFIYLLLTIIGDNCYPELSDFDAIMEINRNDAYRLPLIHFYHNQYPEDYEIAFRLAKTYNRHGNFRKSTKLFEALLEQDLLEIQIESIHFHYAWGLHMLGKQEEAKKIWRTLTASRSVYYKTAAHYFIAAYYFEEKNFEAVNKNCEAIIEYHHESKYAAHCKLKLLPKLEWR